MGQSGNIPYHPDNSVRNRLATVGLLVFVASLMVVSVAFFVSSIPRPPMGITLSLSNQAWRVESVNINGAAYRAGIKAGDRPIEIDGQAAELFLEKYNAAGTALGFLFRELTVVDIQGQTRSVDVNSVSPSGQAVFELLSWFVVSLVFWAIGLFVFLMRPKNVAALLLFVSSAIFGLALGANLAAYRAIPSALQFSVSATVLGPWILLHFFLVLPEERQRLRGSRLIYLLYLLPAITLALFFFIGYADGQPVGWFRSVRFAGIGLVFLATIIVAIFNYFGSVSVKTRQQMKIILVGCLATLAPLLILYLVPRTIWQQPIVPDTISMLFWTFIPLGMAYAVVTQKLMDIDVVIRRGIVYALVTITMAIVLSAAVFLGIIYRKSLGVPGQIGIALILGFIATVLFGPIKTGLETLVDRLFYKDRYDYRQTIQSMGTALNSVRDVTDVSRLVVGTTVSTLNLAGGALFFRSQRGTFEVAATRGAFSDPAKQSQLLVLMSQRDPLREFPNAATGTMEDLAFLIPLTAGQKEAGFLCLSNKATRQTFSSDDLFLLQGLASLAAMALRSAMLVRDVSVRDTFVSIASHELRTPLTAILGYTDLLLRRNPPDATRKQWLTNVLNNSRRVSAMVDDLLNVSRIQSGRVDIKFDKVKLPDVLKETLNLVKESTEKHEFVIDLDPNLPDVRIDRDKFSQVIGNLLSNAVKYSPAGGQISVLARNDKEGRRVVVSVADNGIGIGPEDKDRLFTTFHRIQRPETQGIRGSGLGLYIAKEWTEAMGGKIWLESELNKGSTFFVEVPVNNDI